VTVVVLHAVGGVPFTVDEEDAARVSQVRWHVQTKDRTRYVYDRSQKPHVTLHRFLLTPPEDLEVDHIDGNGLNNSRANLRACSRAENARNRGIPKNNTSGFKGVGWHKRQGAWRAVITLHGKQTHIGYFDTPEEAHAAYVQAAKKLHGEFARPGDFEHRG
jgi:hypothetical protein